MKCFYPGLAPLLLPWIGRRELVVTGAPADGGLLFTLQEISARTDRHFLVLEAESALAALPGLLSAGFQNFLLRFSPGAIGKASPLLWRRKFPSARFGALVGFDGNTSDLGERLHRIWQDSNGPIFLEPDGMPGETTLALVRAAFRLLQDRGVKDFFYFAPWMGARIWEASCLSPFTGPREIQLDLSNRCTHSCHFCALYGPDAVAEVKAKAGGKIPDSYKEVTSLEMDLVRGISILDSLPETTFLVQFGGMGDPALHPDFLEFVRVSRARGFATEVMSNLTYFGEEDLLALHEFAGEQAGSLHFVVNLSGPTEETYLKTRPRQKPGDFQRVLSALARFQALRSESGGRGVSFSLMMVVTSVSFPWAADFVRLGKTVGASEVYLKPVEVHAESIRALVPPIGEKFRLAMRDALAIADSLGVKLTMRSDLEKMAEARPSFVPAFVQERFP